MRKKRFVLNYVSWGRRFPFTSLVCSLYLLDRCGAARWFYWIWAALVIAAVCIVVGDYFVTRQIPIKIEDILGINSGTDEEDLNAKEEIHNAAK